MHLQCYLGDGLLSTAFTGKSIRDSEDILNAKNDDLDDEKPLNGVKYQEAH